MEVESIKIKSPTTIRELAVNEKVEDVVAEKARLKKVSVNVVKLALSLEKTTKTQQQILDNVSNGSLLPSTNGEWKFLFIGALSMVLIFFIYLIALAAIQ